MSAARRSRLPALLVLALVVVPIVEIAVIVAVGRAVGGWPTLLLLLAESALGAWLVRREGARAWRALAQALRSGRMPVGELSDAALVLVGGTLLLTPGFVTDVAGFFFVLPFTRPVARRVLAGVIARRLLGSGSLRPGPTVRGRVVDDPPPPGGTGGGEVVEGEVVDDGPGDDPRRS